MPPSGKNAYLVSGGDRVRLSYMTDSDLHPYGINCVSHTQVLIVPNVWPFLSTGCTLNPGRHSCILVPVASQYSLWCDACSCKSGVRTLWLRYLSPYIIPVTTIVPEFVSLFYWIGQNFWPVISDSDFVLKFVPPVTMRIWYFMIIKNTYNPLKFKYFPIEKNRKKKRYSRKGPAGHRD